MVQEGGRAAFTARLTRRVGLLRAASAAPAPLLRHQRAAPAGMPRGILFAPKPQPLPKGAARPTAPWGRQSRGTPRRAVGRRGAPQQCCGAASPGERMLCRQWGGGRAALTLPARSPAPGASLPLQEHPSSAAQPCRCGRRQPGLPGLPSRSAAPAPAFVSSTQQRRFAEERRWLITNTIIRNVPETRY